MGCRRLAPASELVRVVHAAGGTLDLGLGIPGRGAWLCRDSPGCVDLAERHRAFSRALRHPIGAEAIDELRSRLKGDAGSPFSGPRPRAAKP
ncbi:MAG: YlxR family protein [Acidimicrobiales bacterium]